MKTLLNRLMTNKKRERNSKFRSRFLFVGVTGFEPATTWSQTRCATGLRYAPIVGSSLQALTSAKVVTKNYLCNTFIAYLTLNFVDCS